MLKKINESGVIQEQNSENIHSENKAEKREFDESLVWVVSNAFYDVETMKEIIKEVLGSDVTVKAFFRDYGFEASAKNSQKLPATIITNGICKTKDEYGQSIAIYYDYPFEFAKQNGIKVISPTVMGQFMPKLFKLKMKLFA